MSYASRNQAAYINLRVIRVVGVVFGRATRPRGWFTALLALVDDPRRSRRCRAPAAAKPASTSLEHYGTVMDTYERAVIVKCIGYSHSAERVNARLVLIDGPELAALMIEHDCGVIVEESFVLKQVDENFFEEA
jgi:hypothetical protein